MANRLGSAVLAVMVVTTGSTKAVKTDVVVVMVVFGVRVVSGTVIDVVDC